MSWVSIADAVRSPLWTTNHHESGGMALVERKVLIDVCGSLEALAERPERGGGKGDVMVYTLLDL